MRIEATKKWLDDIVIAHNFCPFARFVRDANSIRFVEEAGDGEAILSALSRECQILDSQPDVSTTLLLATGQAAVDFYAYLDLLDDANTQLDDMGYSGIYQLASFHPDYLFASEPHASPSHYTNRAPYPTFHLIREADIEKALAHYNGSAESIYTQNIQQAERLGVDYFERVLGAIKCPRDSEAK